jgi:hypothetical protein
MKSRIALYALFAVVLVAIFCLRSTEHFVVATSANKVPFYLQSWFLVPFIILCIIGFVALQIYGNYTRM